MATVHAENTSEINHHNTLGMTLRALTRGFSRCSSCCA